MIPSQNVILPTPAVATSVIYIPYQNYGRFVVRDSGAICIPSQIPQLIFFPLFEQSTYI